MLANSRFSNVAILVVMEKDTNAKLRKRSPIYGYTMVERRLIDLQHYRYILNESVLSKTNRRECPLNIQNEPISH
jgi:hypothetical protein